MQLSQLILASVFAALVASQPLDIPSSLESDRYPDEDGYYYDEEKRTVDADDDLVLPVSAADEEFVQDIVDEMDNMCVRIQAYEANPLTHENRKRDLVAKDKAMADRDFDKNHDDFSKYSSLFAKCSPKPKRRSAWKLKRGRSA